MSKSDCELITELKAVLNSQQYSPVVVGNYCAYAREFLNHLARQNTLVYITVTQELLHYANERFRAIGAPCLSLGQEMRS